MTSARDLLEQVRAQIKRVSTEEAAASNATFLDVREMDEYE